MISKIAGVDYSDWDKEVERMGMRMEKSKRPDGACSRCINLDIRYAWSLKKKTCSKFLTWIMREHT